MEFRYDREADTIYLRFFDRRIVESEEVRPGVILDYDERGSVVGIEVLRFMLDRDSAAPETEQASSADAPVEPHTPLVRSLLTARRQRAGDGASFIETWDELDSEIADRRGASRDDRAT